MFTFDKYFVVLYLSALINVLIFVNSKVIQLTQNQLLITSSSSQYLSSTSFFLSGSLFTLQGAKTSTHLALSDDVLKHSGAYFFECAPTSSSRISMHQKEWEKMWTHSLQFTRAQFDV